MYDGISDFRSDTVTRPTPEMRRAMETAVVGDDVFGDDPTVTELEVTAAEILGHESALFVPSGTMGNQIAVRVHTRPGDEVVLEERSHAYLFEQGGLAQISHVQARPLAGVRGRMDPAAVEAAIRSDDVHFPRTSLVIVENTHNASGGSLLPLDDVREIAELCRRRGLRLHIDGARLWNAAAALGLPPRDLALEADTVLCCLSKGLGAPVGSVLAGRKDIIAAARRVRKVLGGGLRQAGVLAAPALVALRTMRARLVEDHARAARLAAGLAAAPGVAVAAPETNIVLADLPEGGPDAAAILGGLRARGVLAVAFGRRRLRFVTHFDIDDRDVARAAGALAAALSG